MKQPRTEKFDIEYFLLYVETYKERHPDQQNIMFLDMLYGVGVAVDQEKFKGADGFRKFILWISESSEEVKFQESQKRFQKAIESLVSPESAGIEWNTKLNEAFQIAAFGEVIDYKPEDYPGEDDPGWLANRNHGG